MRDVIVVGGGIIIVVVVVASTATGVGRWMAVGSAADADVSSSVSLVRFLRPISLSNKMKII